MMATRDHILDAFQRILLERGDRAATLDAVAAEAGVSKGGLIYHFPTRDALIAAFIDRANVAWDRELDEALARGRTVADFYLSPVTGTDADIARALLALPPVDPEAAREDHTLLGLLSKWSDRLRVEVGDDPVRAELIRCVGEGLLMDALVGRAPDPDLLQAVRARLLGEFEA